MKAFIDLKGIEEYLVQLQKAEKDLDVAADNGLRAAGEILIAEMRARVPFDTGNLRDHLVLNGPFQDGDDHYVYAELDMRDRENMLYGVFVEYGTVYTEPRSYIRAGRNAAKSKARQAMISELNKVLEFS
jgi:HK97 gp10 family phage protein